MDFSILYLFVFAPALAFAGLDFDGFVPEMMARDELTELYSRDSEKLPGPLAFGHKHMTGIIATT